MKKIRERCLPFMRRLSTAWIVWVIRSLCIHMGCLIDEDTKNEICGFDPDLCIIFNNSFFDLAEVVDCPIIIYEVDSPLYFSNKDDIRKKPDRYLYFIFQEESRKALKEDYGVDEKQIYFVPFFHL